MKPKILYVGWLSAAQRGAVGTHTSGILKALDDAESVLLKGVFLSFALPNFIPQGSWIFHAKEVRSKFGRLMLTVRYVAYVRRLIALENPDYIYIRFDPFFTPLIAGLSALIEYNDVFLDQIEFVADRGGWTKFGRLLRRSRLYRSFIVFSERYTFRKALRVIAVTEGLVEYCLRVCPESKTVLVMNGSDVQHSSVMDHAFDESLVIGHIGTLTHWDGLDALVDGLALARRLDTSAKFRLRIVGAGAAESDLRKQVLELGLSEVVTFVPPVSHVEAIEELGSVDLVPLLKTISGYGLSPIKFYEALAIGRTVLVSDLPHINEVPLFCGRVVSYPLRFEEIASVLVEMFHERHKIRMRRNEIAQYARSHHSWGARVRGLLESLGVENHIASRPNRELGHNL